MDYNLSNTIRVVSIAFLLVVVAEEEESRRMSATKRLFSLSSDYDSNWLLRKAYEALRWPTYTSPTPNLDFRDEGATTDKLKEAVVKSLDKSKATVEDSAKSAAEFAEDAVDKLKDTFSPSEL